MIEDLLNKLKNLSQSVFELDYNDYSVEFKSDHSPVTSADLMYDKFLTNKLKSLIDIPILSEETTHENYLERKQWPAFWIIDPIDGTKGFTEGSKEWTVNVGLVLSNTIQAGLIVAPALKKAYVGVVGYGAHQFENQIWKSIAFQNTLIDYKSIDSPIVVCSVHHPEKELEIKLAELKKPIKKNIGSSLKLCLIATGEADWYPRYSSLCEWDIAAGHGIIKASGKNLYYIGTQDEHLYNSFDLRSRAFEAY